MGKKKGMDKNTKTFVILMVLAVIVAMLFVAFTSSNGLFGNLMGMNSDILRPNKDIYNNNLRYETTVEYHGGSTFYNSVNEYMMDGDTSYLKFGWNGNLGEQQRVIFGLNQLTKNETIQKIIIHYFIKIDYETYYRNSLISPSARPYLNFESNEFAISDDWLTSRGYAHNYTTINNTAYGEFTDTWFLNPKTNQPWTTNDLNTLNIGFETRGEGFKKLTQLYVEVQPLQSTAINQPVASPSGAPKQTPGFETLTFVVAIGIALVLLNKRKTKKE